MDKCPIQFLRYASVVLFSFIGMSLYAQDFKAYARMTLDSIYIQYADEKMALFREHYPQDETYRADYLGTAANRSNPYAYLWPFSGVLSAQVARYEQSRDTEIREQINHALTGLDHYYDTRQPAAYASYINSASPSDRFYDDNIWIGIDLVDLYRLTRDRKYLEKADEVWRFIESGTDDKLGGGIYWCEQRKESKNTCSNAPGSVLALKLFQATHDSSYFNQGKDLYHWTKENLQDRGDGLYYDNINLEERVEKTKYSYNSGQMIQAAVLLYKITGEEQYLIDAQRVAKASHSFFFQSYPDTDFPRLKNGNLWFHAVMLRGFIELYQVDGRKEYIKTFQQNMQFAWDKMRSEQGLFGTDWTLKNRAKKKWLLDQFAMTEMFARLASLEE